MKQSFLGKRKYLHQNLKVKTGDYNFRVRTNPELVFKRSRELDPSQLLSLCFVIIIKLNLMEVNRGKSVQNIFFKFNSQHFPSFCWVFDDILQIGD